jgi:hypothetical protein
MSAKKQSPQAGSAKGSNQNHSKVPKIRDTPDSRKNEEQNFKGTDVTHNKKETDKER